MHTFMNQEFISNIQDTSHDQGFVINNKLPYNKVEYWVGNNF